MRWERMRVREWRDGDVLTSTGTRTAVIFWERLLLENFSPSIVKTMNVDKAALILEMDN